MRGNALWLDRFPWSALLIAGFFLAVSAWSIWFGFFTRQVFYPFSKRPATTVERHTISLFITIWCLFFAWITLTR
jgi:hypothetical protein